VLEFLPTTNQAEDLSGNFQVRITYDGSKERSVDARDRISEIIAQYRGEWLKREARRRGIDGANWQEFTISSKNVASEKQMGRFILGLVAPIMFVVMVAIGCFYPAVDATAGERERNTWETLMSSAASRVEIVAAKYLYVATLGGVAGILNLAAVMLTLKPIFAPLMASAGQALEFSLPAAALPIAFLAAVLLAGFVAAGMMVFASFARTFKEGQAMITPFYMLILLPAVFLQAPGIRFSPALACVPMVNLTLMIREALSGVFHWGAIGLTLLVSTALIAIAVRLAAFVLQFEDVMLGSYGGSFFKFCRERLFRRPPAA
jgi:sodium transport system permease protein